MLVFCVLIAVVIIGIIIVIYTAVSIKKENNKTDDYFQNNISDNIIKSISDEADDAFEQLNKLSESIFEEFEEKYQELLFLYKMVDDMKNDIDKMNNSSRYIYNPNKDINIGVSSKSKYNYDNPNLDKILELQKQGLSVSEISKSIGIGQGEVKLIMELGKVR